MDASATSGDEEELSRGRVAPRRSSGFVADGPRTRRVSEPEDQGCEVGIDNNTNIKPHPLDSVDSVCVVGEQLFHHEWTGNDDDRKMERGQRREKATLS